MDNIKRIGYKALFKLKRVSPIILSIAAAGGTIATTILAVKATPKALSLIKDAENEKGAPLTKLETVKITAKTYTPTVISGSATILCIIGSSLLGLRQNASLIGAVSLLDKSYKNYREAAKEVYGEDADKRIRAEAARRKYISTNGELLYAPNDDYGDEILFYEPFSQRYFTSTLASVIGAEYTVNRHLMIRGYVPVNEFYDFLGLASIPGGDSIGWVTDIMLEGGYSWLDFENEKTEVSVDGLTCYIISPMLEPGDIEEMI